MSWFRVHNDILDNPKLLMLAPSDRWYFTAILSLKSQGVLDKFKRDKLDKVISTQLRLTLAEWEECSRRLQEEDLIDAKYQPVGWDSRQYKSDNSTERSRKHRARKRAEKVAEEVTPEPAATDETPLRDDAATLHAPLQGRDCNGNVTPPDTDNRLQIQIKNNSEPKGSAANAGNPAKFSRLSTIETYYDSPDQSEESPTSLVFSLGVRTLGRYKIPEKQARAILAMYRRDHGDGPVMDAICEVFCRQPDGDPVGYIATILKSPRHSMPKDWAPNAGVVAQLEALGIKKSVINHARAFFKLWVLERDITSSDFDAWFTEWCIRDFEDSEADLNRMSGWYAPAAKSEFHEPAGGCIA